MNVDVLVVGAGPVGLATAIRAAEAGMTVAVTDPRPSPIDKACGEGLMPSAVDELRELKVEPAGHVLRGITYTSPTGDTSASALFPSTTGLGVRRTTLSAALQDRADELGVARLHRKITSLEQRAQYACADDIRARWVVGADGLHSNMRRLIGANEQPAGHPRRHGLRCHVEVEPWTDMVEVHWGQAAEAYVTPVSARLVGIAVLTSSRGSFDEHMDNFPMLRQRLRDLPTSTITGSGPFGIRASHVVRGRTALVGDASGYVDALTGEGIALGLKQARVPIECLVEEDLDAYPRRWARVSRRARTLTSGLLAASSIDVLRRGLVPTAARLPALMRWGVRMAS
jgi:flavin-dependent dehydrogenase